MDGREISEQQSFRGGSPVLLDLADVDRVEVAWGPSNVAYGSRAIGGSISFITDPPADEHLASAIARHLIGVIVSRRLGCDWMVAMERVERARGGRKASRTRHFALALALLGLAFWSDAFLFHEEEGIDSCQDDCPICQLQRTAGAGAPPEAPVVLVSPIVAVAPAAECPVAPPTIERRPEAWTQRGPPFPA